MKGIYAIVIVFLASWDVSTAEIFIPVITKCPFKERDNVTTTNIPHESDCTKFYKCNNGVPEIQVCRYEDETRTKRLHYNIFEQVCDWPWRAGCASCPLDEDIGVKLPTTLIPSKRDDCNYIKCKNGEPEEKQCPRNTCFSRTCQACVENRKGGNCDDNFNIFRILSPFRCYDGDRMIHECNCSKYYECTRKGEWILRECEPGFHFNKVTNVCTTPDKAKCKLFLQK